MVFGVGPGAGALAAIAAVMHRPNLFYCSGTNEFVNEGVGSHESRVGVTLSSMTDRPSWAARIGPSMKMAALLVGLFTVGVGVVGLLSPASLTAVRREYFATPSGLYSAGAVRLAMGLVVILAATASRAPKTLRVLGALMCMQGLSATILGPARARTVLEWETMSPGFLRAGAAVALTSGVFMVFALTTGRRPAAIP